MITIPVLDFVFLKKLPTMLLVTSSINTNRLYICTF